MVLEVKCGSWIMWEGSRWFAECTRFCWFLAVQFNPSCRSFGGVSRYCAWHAGTFPFAHGLGAGSGWKILEVMLCKNVSKTRASSYGVTIGHLQGLRNKNVMQWRVTEWAGGRWSWENSRRRFGWCGRQVQCDLSGDQSSVIPGTQVGRTESEMAGQAGQRSFHPCRFGKAVVLINDDLLPPEHFHSVSVAAKFSPQSNTHLNVQHWRVFATGLSYGQNPKWTHPHK